MTSFQNLFLGLISSLVMSEIVLANETEICADEPKAIFYENEDKSGNVINYFEETEDYQHIQSIINKRGLKGIPLLCATGVYDNLFSNFEQSYATTNSWFYYKN